MIPQGFLLRISIDPVIFNELRDFGIDVIPPPPRTIGGFRPSIPPAFIWSGLESDERASIRFTSLFVRDNFNMGLTNVYMKVKSGQAFLCLEYTHGYGFDFDAALVRKLDEALSAPCVKIVCFEDRWKVSIVASTADYFLPVTRYLRIYARETGDTMYGFNAARNQAQDLEPTEYSYA